MTLFFLHFWMCPEYKNQPKNPRASDFSGNFFRDDNFADCNS